MDVRLFLRVAVCSGLLLSISCDSSNYGPYRPGGDQTDDSPTAKKDAGKASKKDAGKNSKVDEDEETEDEEEDEETTDEEEEKPKDAGTKKDSGSTRSDSGSSTGPKDSGTTGPSTADSGTMRPPSSTACTNLTYQNFVQPFISTNCSATCHAAGTPIDLSTEQRVRAKAAQILDRVGREPGTPGAMPPPPPAGLVLLEDDHRQILEWAACAAMGQ